MLLSFESSRNSSDQTLQNHRALVWRATRAVRLGDDEGLSKILRELENDSVGGFCLTLNPVD
jgi:hypothetical protein